MENGEKRKNNSIKHFTEGIYTKQEAKEALDLLYDKNSNGVTNKHMSDIWNQIQESTDINEFNEGYDEAGRLLKRIHKVPFYKKYLKQSIVAASVAILISIGIVGYKYLASWSDSAIHYAEVSTSFGETRRITLPDGTVVALNACSQISYPSKFTGDERLVKLSGEAYFQVTKNAKQPFVVNTDNFNVRVLGTVFNIHAYKGDQMEFVNVESGKVQIDMPDAMSRLSSNEQITINTLSYNYTKEYIQKQDIAPWRTGDFYFSNTPIKDVTNQLERIYNYSIVFQAEQDLNHLISGEHHKGSLEEILESICLATGIKYKIDNHKKHITLYK